MERLPKEVPFFLTQRGGMTILDALLISAIIDRPAKLLIPKIVRGVVYTPNRRNPSRNTNRRFR